MNGSTPRYSGDIADIIDLLGMDDAAIIVERLGGIDLKVPASVASGHALMRLPEGVRQRFLGAFSPGEMLYIPRSLGDKQALAAELAAEGKTHEEIALTLGVSMRTVRNWKKSLPAPRDDRQIDMFEDQALPAPRKISSRS